MLLGNEINDVNIFKNNTVAVSPSYIYWALNNIQYNFFYIIQKIDSLWWQFLWHSSGIVHPSDATFMPTEALIALKIRASTI